MNWANASATVDEARLLRVVRASSAKSGNACSASPSGFGLLQGQSVEGGAGQGVDLHFGRKYKSRWAFSRTLQKQTPGASQMRLRVFEVESIINSDMFSLFGHSMMQSHSFGRGGYIYVDMLQRLSGGVATEFPKLGCCKTRL